MGIIVFHRRLLGDKKKYCTNITIITRLDIYLQSNLLDIIIYCLKSEFLIPYLIKKKGWPVQVDVGEPVLNDYYNMAHSEEEGSYL